MIRYTPASERKFSLFKTPFENELDPANRWVRMAELVPWDDMAQVFMDRSTQLPTHQTSSGAAFNQTSSTAG